MNFFEDDSFCSYHASDDSDNESIFMVMPTKTKQIQLPVITLNKRILRKNNKWHISENSLYVQFLIKNFDLFQQKIGSRRDHRVFHLMAKLIISKNYAQCRIHHLKMMKRYKSTEKIIKTHRNRIQRAERRNQRFQNQGINFEMQQESFTQTIDEISIWKVIQEQSWTRYEIVSSQL